MSEHTTNAIVQTAKLVTLGDAIRAKAGLSDEMTLDEMATAVANITTAGTYQSKTVSPSTSAQTVTPDDGYDALSSVTVNAMATGSATTPATTITATPTISVSSSGLVTASVSTSKSVTPTVSAGYVSSGTAGTVSVSGSNTKQLTTKSAQTYTPTTTSQTIASGQYLTGTQTIAGDANLIAENIKDGVTIFGVTGTYTGGSSGYTVTVNLTNPSSPGSFRRCEIFTALSASVFDTGEILGNISSAAGSTTVTVPTSVYGIVVNANGTSVAMGTCTGTDGVSFVTYEGDYALFQVTGDGTATLDGIEYDD